VTPSAPDPDCTQDVDRHRRAAVEEQSWEMTYPGKREILSGLRKDVREVLVKSDCPETVADTVVLAMSELASNAVIHTPSGWNQASFIARVFTYADRSRPYIWAEVENDGFGAVDLANLPAQHGLDIVRRLVSRIGTERGTRGRVVYIKLEYSEKTGEVIKLAKCPEPNPEVALALHCLRQQDSRQMSGSGGCHISITALPHGIDRTLVPMQQQEHLRLKEASQDDIVGLAAVFDELSKYSPLLAPHFKSHVATAVIELKNKLHHYVNPGTPPESESLSLPTEFLLDG
jgi:anti-sigma regulatory factor (Ser/Thr protein kinase)